MLPIVVNESVCMGVPVKWRVRCLSEIFHRSYGQENSETRLAALLLLCSVLTLSPKIVNL